jgi:predicted RNA-binding Zn-ribbon protein involved in translation (DUF1610 family)
MWVIEKLVKKGDYDYAIVRNHPKASDRGYVLYHRIIMENHINRLLLDNEIVHHIDENKHNNDIDNLELMDRAEHTRHHFKTGRTFIKFTCPNCGIVFDKEIRQIKKNTIPKCSRKCNGEYSRKIQLGII